ncbi:MAG: hypothetical protein QXI58_00150 [Candidatus Micrarchaeia archaeon]
MQFITQRLLQFFRTIDEIKAVATTSSPILYLHTFTSGSSTIRKILFYIYDSTISDDETQSTSYGVIYTKIKSNVLSGGWLLVYNTENILSFLDLTDTPNSYSGYAGFYVRVKGDASGLEFAPTLSTMGTAIQFDTVDTAKNIDISSIPEGTIAYIKETKCLYRLSYFPFSSVFTITPYDVNILTNTPNYFWLNLNKFYIYLQPVTAVTSVERSGLFYNDAIPVPSATFFSLFNSTTNFFIDELNIVVTSNSQTLHLDFNNRFIKNINLFYYDTEANLHLKKVNVYNLKIYTKVGLPIPGSVTLEDCNIANEFWISRGNNIYLTGSYIICNSFKGNNNTIQQKDNDIVSTIVSINELFGVRIASNNVGGLPTITARYFYHNNIISQPSSAPTYGDIAISDYENNTIPFLVYEDSSTSQYPSSSFFYSIISNTDTSKFNELYLAGKYGARQLNYKFKNELNAFESLIYSDKGNNDTAYVVRTPYGYLVPVIDKVYDFFIDLPLVITSDASYIVYDLSNNRSVLLLIPLYFLQDYFDVLLFAFQYKGDFTIDIYSSASTIIRSLTISSPSSFSTQIISFYKFDDNNTSISPLSPIQAIQITERRGVKGSLTPMQVYFIKYL